MPDVEQPATPAARVVDAEAEVVRAARAFVNREPSVCEAFVALARAVRLLEDARAPAPASPASPASPAPRGDGAADGRGE